MIYNQDCLEGMKALPDGCIDCVICDPPYGVLSTQNSETGWDAVIDFDEMWKQLLRVCKDNAAIVLFASGSFTHRLAMSKIRLFRYSLVWDKGQPTGFLNAWIMPMRQHEDILVFYRHKPTFNPQLREGNVHGGEKARRANRHYNSFKVLTSAERAERDKAKGRTKPDSKSLPIDILRFPKEKGKDVFHPTQKPVDIIRWLVRTYTNRGETVLDFCMGSGTTAVACILEGRKYVGYETDRFFYEKSLERIEQAERQAGEEQ